VMFQQKPFKTNCKPLVRLQYNCNRYTANFASGLDRR
jgi:hypothetical protein